MSEQSKRGRDERRDIPKTLTWNFCDKHKQDYPKGTKCPKCEAEQQQKKR